MVGGYAPQVYTDDELVLTDLVEGFVPLDIRDPSAVKRAVAAARPDVVLHLAAATDVDRCEQDPDWAYGTNAMGTQNLALACLEYRTRLVYVSTGAVFWGEKPEPYIEFDDTRPANLYGRSKLAGEQIIASLLHRYYIVRAGWMFGGGEHKDKKFVGKIARLIAEGKQTLEAVHDKRGSPTYAKELLAGIGRLIETGQFGLYHMANVGQCSRYEMALTIRDALQCPDVMIQPVPSDRFPLPAPRGGSEALRNLKLELLGLHVMRSWQEAMRDYVQTELAPSLSLLREPG